MRAETFQGLIDRLRLRKRAYREIVLGPPGTASHEFLTDIAKFCRAFETTWSEDARHHARLEGRREVWLRIQQHIHLEPEQMAALYRAVTSKQLGETA